MAIYIISDLHLHEDKLDSSSLFDSFMNKKILSGKNTLYILGDFFEYYIGDDILSPFQRSILEKLNHAVSVGTKIFFMPGNRDFLVGLKFEKLSGAKVIQDPFILNIYNHKVQLMHGDLLCTDDYKYQIFRSISRNYFIKKLFLLLPKSLRKKIAINLRKKSTHYQREIKVDITTKGLSKYVKNKNVLIHGHTHIIGTHLHGQLYRLVLSDWHTQGSFISIKDKQISLYSFFPIEKIGSSYSL